MVTIAATDIMASTIALAAFIWSIIAFKYSRKASKSADDLQKIAPKMAMYEKIAEASQLLINTGNLLQEGKEFDKHVRSTISEVVQDLETDPPLSQTPQEVEHRSAYENLTEAQKNNSGSSRHRPIIRRATDTSRKNTRRIA